MVSCYAILLFQLERIQFAVPGNVGTAFRLIILLGATNHFHRSNEHLVFSKEIKAQIDKSYEDKRIRAIAPEKEAAGKFSARKGELAAKRQQLLLEKQDLEAQLVEERTGEVVNQTGTVSGVAGDGPRANTLKQLIAN